MDKATREDKKIFNEAIKRINRRRAKRGQPPARFILKLGDYVTISRGIEVEITEDQQRQYPNHQRTLLHRF